ncbi:MAG: hypothetical protein Q8S73_36990 [Deltaproteobacteria bacterium]|nr:hypothetical protein [Myxococcales bacterium]MDP3219757.1 hypothetical protein [Deltaproteobacteria bacterium]
MTPTPPSGIPVAIAGQLHRDDGQDRGIRALWLALAALVVGALVGVWYVARSERPAAPPPPPPVVHVAAAPPCPACPPCAACPACPQPAPRSHRR